MPLLKLYLGSGSAHALPPKSIHRLFFARGPAFLMRDLGADVFCLFPFLIGIIGIFPPRASRVVRLLFGS